MKKIDLRHGDVSEKAFEIYSNSTLIIAQDEQGEYAIYDGSIDRHNLISRGETMQGINDCLIYVWSDSLPFTSRLFKDIDEGTAKDKSCYGFFYLLEDAYADVDFRNNQQNPVFMANAINHKGENFRIIWQIINNECEDLSECCDWENFEVIRR